MPTESTINRYLSICQLARRGSPGERENAQKAKARMESEYPNIERAASDYLKMRAARETPEPQASSTPRTKPDILSEVLKYGQFVVEGVSRISEQVNQAILGKRLASHVEENIRPTRTNGLLLSLRLSESVIEEAVDLNDAQFEAFRQGLHEKLDSMILSVFIPQEEEDEEFDDE